MRSNRIDTPGRGRLAVADAVVTAADTVVATLTERKRQDDRFNYAMAKNELLTADIQNREALKDDKDWETYDERYRTGVRTDRDRITSEYQLNPNDQAIFDAEADLVTERGAVQVGDYGRTVEIDDKVAGMSASLAAARENIILADPLTRNDLLLTQLDAITALEDEGVLTDVQAEKSRQGFTQDAATASLLSMDTEDAIEMIKKSLAKRSGGQPITSEDVRAGKGTGSIADFLHADQAAEMLDTLEREDKTTKDRTAAFSVVDEAFELLPGNMNAGKRMTYIRDNLRGNADARDIGERSGRQRNNEEAGIQADMVGEAMRENGRRMREEEDFTYDSIPADEKAIMSPAQDKTMRAYDSLLRNAKQFADVTNWHDEGRDPNGNLTRPAYSTWGDMTPQQKAQTDLDDPMWYTNLALPQWKQLEDEQTQIREGTVTQDQGMTDDQILQSVVVGNGILPQTGRNDAENAAYQRLRFRFRDDVKALSDQKFGGGKVPYQERRDLLLNILGEQAWRRDAGMFGFDASLDEPEPMFQMTPKQMKAGFIPLSLVRQQKTSVNVAGTQIEMTWEQRLKNLSRERLNGRIPEDKDIENAYFAVRAGMSDQEVLRRLAGKGDY